MAISLYSGAINWSEYIVKMSNDSQHIFRILEYFQMYNFDNSTLDCVDFISQMRPREERRRTKKIDLWSEQDERFKNGQTDR